jgi:hypothetical protein
VELARELDEDGTRKHPIAQLARDLKISESCLRNWLAADEVETGERPGLTKAEARGARAAAPGKPGVAGGA